MQSPIQSKKQGNKKSSGGGSWRKWGKILKRGWGWGVGWEIKGDILITEWGVRNPLPTMYLIRRA